MLRKLTKFIQISKLKNLKKLHSLSLLECGIEAIEIGTFSDLKQLTTLGLNFNSFQGFIVCILDTLIVV